MITKSFAQQYSKKVTMLSQQTGKKKKKKLKYKKKKQWLVLNLYTLYLEISHLKDLEGTKKILTNPRREVIRNTTDKVDNNG